MAAKQPEENRSHSVNSSHNRIDEIRYDPQRKVYHTDVEVTPDVSLCLEVVWALAEVTGTDPVAFEPIASVIDPGALDTFLSGDSIEHLEVTFTYEGWTVTVTCDGEIVFSESD